MTASKQSIGVLCGVSDVFSVYASVVFAFLAWFFAQALICRFDAVCRYTYNEPSFTNAGA